MRGRTAKKSIEIKGLAQRMSCRKPTFMAYELRLLCHTNPDFYAIWAAFIGGGGGLQFFEAIRITAIWAAIPTLILNRFSGNFSRDFTGALRFQIAQFYFGTRQIGANPEKSDLVNFQGPDWRKFGELCVLLLGKTDNMLPKSRFSKPSETNNKNTIHNNIWNGSGTPNRRKWGSLTFGEGVRNWFRNPLLLVDTIQNPLKRVPDLIPGLLPGKFSKCTFFGLVCRSHSWLLWFQNAVATLRFGHLRSDVVVDGVFLKGGKRPSPPRFQPY